jgi:hypothetical protein
MKSNAKNKQNQSYVIDDAINTEISSIYGCYYCGNLIKPKDLEEWGEGSGVLVCPYCHVDAVIVSSPENPVEDLAFLQELHDQAFGMGKLKRSASPRRKKLIILELDPDGSGQSGLELDTNS